MGKAFQVSGPQMQRLNFKYVESHMFQEGARGAKTLRRSHRQHL